MEIVHVTGYFGMDCPNCGSNTVTHCDSCSECFKHNETVYCDYENDKHYCEHCGKDII